MTALFVVIAVEQWKAAGKGARKHLPALIGFGCTIASVVVTRLLGSDNMLIPALVAICVLLLTLRGSWSSGKRRRGHDNDTGCGIHSGHGGGDLPHPPGTLRPVRPGRQAAPVVTYLGQVLPPAGDRHADHLLHPQHRSVLRQPRTA